MISFGVSSSVDQQVCDLEKIKSSNVLISPELNPKVFNLNSENDIAAVKSLSLAEQNAL